MRVNIGPYKHYIGPYQVADTLRYFGLSEDNCDKLGKFLADSFVGTFLEFIDKKRKRKIKVKIHDYDTWSADETLACIILPLLKKFKDNKHGAPFVDDEDVPESYRSYHFKKKNEYDIDDFHFIRFDYILDQIIWSFEQIHPDNDWESQYRSGNIDFHFEKVDDSDLSEMIKGPNDTYSFDIEGYKAHQDKISKGLVLFGRYFQSIWS